VLRKQHANLSLEQAERRLTQNSAARSGGK
jgi:hypothetical protein